MSGPHAHIALGKRGHEASTMGNAATGNCDTEKRRCLDVSESTGVKSRSAAASVITVLKDIDAAVCDSRDTLNMSYLLEWMDATSCLAAERHCGRSAVTLVMDDLDFTENYCALLKRGERCILEGKVTRAFGSSLEVVVRISVAEVHSGTLRMVGNAYFMYVVLKTEAEKAGHIKVEVPTLVPSTAEEVLEYGLAERRRNFRKKREAQVEELVKSTSMEDEASSLSPKARPGGALTFTELVLPVHANHMGNTFGGQIMHWMVKGAKTAVWLHLRLGCAPQERPDADLGVGGKPRIRTEQLLHSWLKPESVDTVHFKAPSHVGDRVVVSAAVTRVFSQSIEVAVRVSSNSVNTQDTPTEVNVGHLNFSLMGPDGPLTAHVPDVTPSTIEQDLEYRRAIGRQKFRELRHAEVKRPTPCPGSCSLFSVDLDVKGSQVQEVAIQCISCILCLNDNATLRWERLSSDEGVQCWVEFGLSNTASVTRLKIQATVKASPKDCFELLKDAKRRPEFDAGCLEVLESEITQCGENADLVTFIYAAAGGKKEELLILRAHQEDEACNVFVICSRSVRCDSRPPREGMHRGEVLPSGFIVAPAPDTNGTCSQVTFLGQFSQSLFEVIQPIAVSNVKRFRGILETTEGKPNSGGY